MFKNILLFCFLIPLLFSCAEVGLISGGAKDIYAPMYIEVNPPHENTNFNSNKVEFIFNEYIKLNNPNTTICLSPNNSKIKTNSKGKYFTVFFSDTLEKNTTYQLQLNQTIQDITEGNDSLITYVFSTGEKLDSLQCNILVIDSYTGKSIKNISVGLFRDQDSTTPFYLRKTDNNGLAHFSYLKKGIYKVKAWEEGNDFTYDKKFGLLKEPIFIDFESNDTTKILFANLEKKNPEISFYQLSDFLVAIKGVKHKDFISTQFKNDSLRKLNSYWYSNDSIIIESKYKAYDKIILNYQLDQKIMDTVFTIEKLKSEAKLSITPIDNKKQFKYNEPLLFVLNDFVFIDEFVFENNIDTANNWPYNTENVTILNLQINDTLDNEIKNKWMFPVQRLISPDRIIDGKTDSDSLTFIHFKPNQFKLRVDDVKSIKVIFNPNAIKGNYLPNNDSIEYNLEISSKKDLGSILVDVKNLDSSDLVYLMKNQKNIEKKKVNNESILQFKDLFPGNYSFKIVKDTDNNQKWSQWSINPFKEPEKILWFNTPVKVRANWEIKMELESSNEQK